MKRLIKGLLAMTTLLLSSCGSGTPKLVRKLWCRQYIINDPYNVYCLLQNGNEQIEWRGKLDGFYVFSVGQNTWYEYDNGEHYLFVRKDI